MKDIIKYYKKEKYKEDINVITVLLKEYYNYLNIFKKRLPRPPLLRGTNINIYIELKEGATLPRIYGLRRILEEEAKIVK